MTSGRNNGLPTTEEVLASFQRPTLGDTPNSAPFTDNQTEEDDFELPAMFRRGLKEQPPASISLVERLGAALRALPATEGGNSAGDVSASPRPIASPQLTAGASAAPLYPERVPREMPPCRDRLMVRMGGAAEPQTVAPASRASVVPKGTVGGFGYLLGEGSALSDIGVADETDDEAGLIGSLPPTPRDRAIEDPGSELLRPMLKQWLNDNMDRMLAQALSQTAQRERRV